MKPNTTLVTPKARAYVFLSFQMYLVYFLIRLDFQYSGGNPEIPVSPNASFWMH